MPKCICAHGFKMGTSTSLLDAGHIGARLWLRFLQRADDGAWQYSLCLFACFSCLLPAASLLCSGVHFGLLTGAVEHRGPHARRCVQACFGPWHTGHCLPLLIFGLERTKPITASKKMHSDGQRHLQSCVDFMLLECKPCARTTPRLKALKVATRCYSGA